MIYAIGDIHGEIGPLHTLLQLVERDANDRGISRPRLVLLGDYGDRGPNSRGVYDLLSSEDMVRRFNPFFIRGNHEIMLMDAENDFSQAFHWLENGGLSFLKSYGFDPAKFSAAMLSRFFDEFPDRHRIFLARTKLWHLEGGFLFVHAGIDPKSPSSRDPGVLTWIRDDFLDEECRWEETVVHGHTPSFTVEVKEGRIGVDTGAGYGAGFSLSAAILEPFGSVTGILDVEI